MKHFDKVSNNYIYKHCYMSEWWWLETGNVVQPKAHEKLQILDMKILKSKH